jgi:hypothetical protein|tara:strand:+ start:323 stop:805 length:483 start_codon:yes stop_codon:yes gene_type:complete
MATLNFNAATVAPSENEFSVIPAGMYNATITGSDQVVAKSGNGEYLKLEFTIIDGPAANRKIWSILNLWNTNVTAVDIAQRDLAAICTAVNLPGAGDSVELHNKPLQIRVGIRRSEEWGDQNDIKGYSAVSGPVMAATAPTAPAAPTAAPAEPAAAPWAS